MGIARYVEICGDLLGMPGTISRPINVVLFEDGTPYLKVPQGQPRVVPVSW